MSRGFPSMTALLGLLAIAGYQNRDKIADMLKGATQGGSVPGGAPGASPGGTASGGGLGGLLQNLGGAGASGGFLNGGLGELVDSFRQNGHGEAADSWVKSGPNRPIEPNQLEQAIGSDTLANLERQTGLSKEELLARLSRSLPEAVDKYTPDGRLPA